MKNKIKQLEEELHEQCVLNGKGAEREAALLAKVERLERENAALNTRIEELDAKWRMAEAQCFDQVGKIGEQRAELAALRADKARIVEELEDVQDYLRDDSLRAEHSKDHSVTINIGHIHARLRDVNAALAGKEAKP